MKTIYLRIKRLKLVRSCVCAALVAAMLCLNSCDAVKNPKDKTEPAKLQAVNLSFEQKNGMAELISYNSGIEYDSSDPAQEGVAMYLATDLAIGLLGLQAYPSAGTSKQYSPYNDGEKFKKDPLKAFKFSNTDYLAAYGYSKCSGEDVDWLLKNILNFEPSHRSEPAYLEFGTDDENSGPKLRYYYYKGNYYVEYSGGIGDEYGYKLMFDRVVSDGTLFYVSYKKMLGIMLEFDAVKADSLETGYATLKINRVDGEDYWSIVKMSSEPYFDFSPYYSDEQDNKWQKLYINEIKKLKKEYNDSLVCSIVYIDDDNIPELILDTSVMAGGGEVCLVHNNKLATLDVWCGGVSYIERKNLLKNTGGRMESYFDELYSVKDGEFVKVASGEYGVDDASIYEQDDFDFDNVEDYYKYRWNDKTVTKKQYKKCLKNAYDELSETNPYKNSYSATYMISMLRNDFYDFYPVYDFSDDDNM